MLNQMRTLHVKIVFIGLLSVSIQNAYTISDQVRATENIIFHWTVNNDPFTGFWNFIYECSDGTHGPGLAQGTFNWRNKDGKGSTGGCTFTFTAPADATDWDQTVGTTGGGGQSRVYSGDIHKDSPWHFEPLSALDGLQIRIPDLAPIVTSGQDVTIYTAVNLPLYLADNPFGFFNGNWSVGQTLSDLGVTIAGGQIAGLQGIYFATTPFGFNPDPNGVGFSPEGGDSTLLDSSTYPYDILIVEQHQTTPELPTGFLTSMGVLAAARRYQLRSRNTKA